MAGRLSGWAILVCMALCFGQSLAVTAADKPIDVSKLKKGDKVEVEQFGKWQPGRFVERVSNKLVRVQVPDFPGPIGVLIDNVRLPAKAGKVSGTRASDDPFATPEEKAHIGEMRNWTAAGGKSTVEAQLLRIEGNSVLLRRSDEKEITVPLEKLGEADRKYIADVKSGKVTLKAAQIENGAEAAVESGEPSVPITDTDLSEAEQVQISSDAAWKYTPAAVTAAEFPKTASIKLRPSPDIFEQVEQVFLLTSPRKAIVSMRHTPPGRAASNRLQVVNLTKRQLESDIALDSGVSTLAMTADGSLLVARTERTGLGAQSELRLYQVESNSAKLLARWLPFQSKADGNQPRGHFKSDVDWASFVDTNHLVTLSKTGQLALWTVPELKPVYTLQTATQIVPALQAGNLAVLTESHVAFLRATDGSLMGAIPLDSNDGFTAILAFSEDGSKLAARQQGRVRVWDLKCKELWREFSVSGQSGPPSIGWSGDFLGVDGAMVLDPDRRLSVAQNTMPLKIEAVTGGTAWSVKRGAGGAANDLIGGPILPKGFKNPLANKTADELLAVKPGMEVAVDMNVGNDETRKLVIARLESQGLKIVPKSNVCLVGTLATGSIKAQNYQQRRGPRQQTAVTVTEQILTLKWMVGDEVVWTVERRYGAPSHIRMQPGESIQQAVDRASKANPESLASVWVPAYVAVAPKDSATTKTAGGN